jgi:hypothetical protein
MFINVQWIYKVYKKGPKINRINLKSAFLTAFLPSKDTTPLWRPGSEPNAARIVQTPRPLILAFYLCASAIL